MELLLIIIAIVGFIYYYSKRNSPQRREQERARALKDIIPELRSALKQKNVANSLKMLIEKYKKDVQKYEYFEESEELATNAGKNEQAQEEIPIQDNKSDIVIQSPNKASTSEASNNPPIDIEKAWSNWYSDNSINLLLYIGAFFIVASASIFVGFQWGTIAGVVKAISFSFFTFAFLVCGLIFFRIKSIKSAGITFISIAAILIPFNGVSWFNFYFGPQGQTPGGVWLITSIVSISVYFMLAIYLKRILFSYIAALGVLSLVLSVVNVMQLHTEFYVLGGIFSAFLLLVPGRFLRVSDDKSLEIISEPLSISAQVVLPITLIFGLYFAFQQNIIITLPTSISLFLSAIFYVLSHRVHRKDVYLVVAQILFPLSVYTLLRTEKITPGNSLLLLQIIPFAYLFVANYIKDSKGWLMYCTNILAGLIATISIFINISSSGFYSIFVSLSFILVSIHFLTSYFIEKKLDRLIIPLSLFPLSLFIFMRYLNIDFVVAFIFLEILSIGYLLIAYQTKKYKEESSLIFKASNALVIASAFLGTTLIFSKGSVSFSEMTLISLIGLFYCVFAYFLFGRQRVFYAIGGFIFPIFVYFLTRFTGQSVLISLNLVQVVGIFYILIIANLKSQSEEEKSIGETLANVITPFAGAVISFYALFYSNTLFIPEVVFSGFMGVCYYAVSYYFKKEKIYLIFAEFVFLWFFYILLSWMKIERMYIYYILSSICGAYLVLSETIKPKLVEESKATLDIAVIMPALIFAIVFVQAFSSKSELFVLALFPLIYSITAFVLRKTLYFVALHILFEVISCYFLIFGFFHTQNQFEFLGYLYLVVGVIYYGVYFFVKNNDTKNAFLTGAIVNGLLAISLTFTHSKPGSVVVLIEAIIAFSYQIYGKKEYGIYIANFLLSLALFLALRGWLINLYWYPLSFMVIFIVEYIVFAFTKGLVFTRDFRNSSIVGAFIIVAFFWYLSFSQPTLQFSTLYSAYFLTALIVFDAWFVKEKHFGYLASAVGMLTYLWQVHLIGQTEIQIYLLPLGVYFLVLSYFTRNEKNRDITKGLEYGGLGVLLVPLLFQSFGNNGFYYSLLLGLEGAVLLFVGISINRKMLRYIGIAAICSGVLSQTYNFLFTLPRWVAAAIAGLIFISVAIYLLIKREDLNKKA